MTHLSMTRHIALALVSLALSAIFASVALADAVSEAKALNDAFTAAFEKCDVPAVLNLYEDNAVLIWPGQGEFAIGKPAIEKVVEGYCKGSSKPSIKVISSDARPVGLDHIIHFGQLDTTIAGPDGKPVTIRVRTSELLHKTHGNWRFEVDHASAGLPSPAGADAGKAP